VERLINLQKKLDGDFATLGFPVEDRPFRAHLTLGRIKDPSGLTGINDALNKNSAFTAGEFIADKLFLFQSNLTPQGAVYTKLAEFALDG
jgi:2'-5' RNA ligase